MLRVTAVHPDPCVDAAHAIQEQHRAGQAGYRVGIDGVPLGGGQLEVQVEFRARLSQRTPVQVFAEREPVPGIPGIDGESDRRRGHMRSLRRVDVAPVWLTTKRTGARSARAATWVMMPIIRSESAASRSTGVPTVSRGSWSSVPNPSPRNMESRRR